MAGSTALSCLSYGDDLARRMRRRSRASCQACISCGAQHGSTAMPRRWMDWAEKEALRLRDVYKSELENEVSASSTADTREQQALYDRVELQTSLLHEERAAYQQLEAKLHEVNLQLTREVVIRKDVQKQLSTRGVPALLVEGRVANEEMMRDLRRRAVDAELLNVEQRNAFSEEIRQLRSELEEDQVVMRRERAHAEEKHKEAARYSAAQYTESQDAAKQVTALRQQLTDAQNSDAQHRAQIWDSSESIEFLHTELAELRAEVVKVTATAAVELERAIAAETRGASKEAPRESDATELLRSELREMREEVTKVNAIAMKEQQRATAVEGRLAINEDKLSHAEKLRDRAVRTEEVATAERAKYYSELVQLRSEVADRSVPSHVAPQDMSAQSAAANVQRGNHLHSTLASFAHHVEEGRGGQHTVANTLHGAHLHSASNAHHVEQDVRLSGAKHIGANTVHDAHLHSASNAHHVEQDARLSGRSSSGSRQVSSAVHSASYSGHVAPSHERTTVPSHAPPRRTDPSQTVHANVSRGLSTREGHQTAAPRGKSVRFDTTLRDDSPPRRGKQELAGRATEGAPQRTTAPPRVSSRVAGAGFDVGSAGRKSQSSSERSGRQSSASQSPSPATSPSQGRKSREGSVGSHGEREKQGSPSSRHSRSQATAQHQTLGGAEAAASRGGHHVLTRHTVSEDVLRATNDWVAAAQRESEMPPGMQAPSSRAAATPKMSAQFLAKIAAGNAAKKSIGLGAV